MKKIFLFFVFFIIFCFFVADTGVVHNCYADELVLQDEITNEVEVQLEEIDLEDIEEYVKNLDSETKEIFKYSSFKDLIKAILNGQEEFSITTIPDFLFNSIKSSIKSILPTCILIFVISLIYSIFCRTSFGPSKKVVYFICVVSISLTVVLLYQNSVKIIEDIVVSLKNQMNLIFPILFTLMCAMSGDVTVLTLKPLVSFLSVIISNICVNILLPLAMYSLVFTIAGSLNDDIKLDKFVNFIQSIFKWVLGVCCSIYIGFLSVKTISTSLTNGISVKITKSAIKNYLPYIGGVVSDSFDILRAGSLLLKNAVGVGALILLISTIIAPLVSMIVLNLILKFASGICEPLSDGKISALLSKLSKSICMLIACLVCVVIMYFVTLLLITCVTVSVV